MTEKAAQFEKEWRGVRGHLLFAEILHKADTTYMPKFFGFSYDGHFFIVDHGIMSFVKNKETAGLALLAGAKKYRDPVFSTFLEKEITRLEKKIATVCNKIIRNNLNTNSNKQLWELYSSYVESIAELFAFYRFTRNDFYEDVVKEIKKQLPDPKDATLDALFKSKYLGSQISSSVYDLVNALNTVGKQRWGMHKTWLKSFAIGERLFTEISKRLGVSSGEVTYVLTSEMKAHLLEGVKPDISVLRERSNYAELIYTTGDFRVVTQPEMIKELLAESHPLELRGIPANKGYAKGNVRIIREGLLYASKKELGKVQSGDIIVTNMTSPDMVIAMERAAAFVTNEGGTLCHAAIIAREMNKPCIVSTLHATDFFKDGDLVEVDANNGVVRKIK